MLYIARHGQTEANRLCYLDSQTLDMPLNETGHNQARNLGYRLLKEGKIDLIEVSPIQRAIKTADIIGETIAPPYPSIVYNPDLLEINCGSLDGMKYEEVKQKYPDLFKAWWDATYPDKKHNYPFPGGESYEQILNRAREVVQHLKSASKHLNNILIVGHGTMNAIISCMLLGIGTEKFGIFQFENCGLLKIANANFMNNEQTHIVIS